MTQSVLSRAEPKERFTVEHFEWWIEHCGFRLEGQEEDETWPIEDFQREILADIFGVPGGGEVWVVIPQSNAKTTLLAGVALYHLQHTPSPWVPVGAAAREQAEIMMTQASGFVERAKPFVRGQFIKDSTGMFQVQRGHRRILSNPNGGAGLKVYAADQGTADGVIPTMALVDELHRHVDLGLYRLWKGKLRKRRGTIVTITTAGEPGTEFEEQRERIRNEAVETDRDGLHIRATGKGGRLVFHEWRVQPDEAFADMEVVKQANPLSAITVTDLQEDFESPTMDVGDWKRLQCNIASRSAENAITDAEWDEAVTDEWAPVGEPVAVGADFAWKWDTTAIVPLWMRDIHDRVIGPPEIIVPPRDGSTTHPEEIKAAFRRLNERNPMQVVIMDITDAADIAAWIQDEFPECDVVDRSTGNVNQVKDYDNFTEALRNGWLKHTGHPTLRAHVLNAVAYRLPGGDRKFERPSASRNGKRQDRRVIDALVAAAMVNTDQNDNWDIGGEVMTFTTADLGGDQG